MFDDHACGEVVWSGMKWCLNWASFYPCKIELLSTVFGYSCRWMKNWETNCLHGIRFSYGQKWVSTLMTGRCEVVKHYVSKKNICEIIPESLIKYESWTQFTSQFSLNAKDIDKPGRKKNIYLKKKNMRNENVQSNQYQPNAVFKQNLLGYGQNQMLAILHKNRTLSEIFTR